MRILKRLRAKQAEIKPATAAEIVGYLEDAATAERGLYSIVADMMRICAEPGYLTEAGRAEAHRIATSALEKLVTLDGHARSLARALPIAVAHEANA